MSYEVASLPYDFLFPIVYLLIGAFFGELSLRVEPEKEPAPGVKIFTYFIAMLLWPLVVILAAIKGNSQ